jgi:hypothetical protein
MVMVMGFVDGERVISRLRAGYPGVIITVVQATVVGSSGFSNYPLLTPIVIVGAG